MDGLEGGAAAVSARENIGGCAGDGGRPRLKGTRPAEIFFTAGLGQVKKVFRGWELR